VIYITTIRVTREIQWNRCEIRVTRRMGGTKKRLISDRYHDDQGKKGDSNGMGRK
jgi:hypothetical protein